MAAWLPFLRRIVTPIVSGTALMLIAVSVMPIAVGRLTDVPRGRAGGRGPDRRWRDAGRRHRHGAARVGRLEAVGAPSAASWPAAPPALFFGLYDLRPVAAASWFDLPDVAAWPGMDLTPGARFWALLPVFVIVSVVAAIKTSSDGAVIQQASLRKPRATDFRLVQGALNASGVGILLSGIAVTPPVIIYLPSSVSLINLTRGGGAQRRIRHRGHPVRAGVPAETDGWDCSSSRASARCSRRASIRRRVSSSASPWRSAWGWRAAAPWRACWERRGVRRSATA